MLEGVLVKEGLKGEDGSADERNGKGMISPVGKRVERFIVSSWSFDVTGMGESSGNDITVFVGWVLYDVRTGSINRETCGA